RASSRRRRGRRLFPELSPALRQQSPASRCSSRTRCSDVLLKLTAGEIADAGIARAERVDQGKPLVELPVTQSRLGDPGVERLDLDTANLAQWMRPHQGRLARSRELLSQRRCCPGCGNSPRLTLHAGREEVTQRGAEELISLSESNFAIVGDKA